MIERYSMQEEAEALRALERTIGLPQNRDELKAMLDAVRAEERERVIAEFAGDLVSQFAAVRADERERCARIAEHFDQLPPATIASAIRNENIGESEERTSAHE